MSKKKTMNLPALLGLLLLTAGKPLHAEVTTWDGSTANWSETLHWDNGVPEIGDDVIINAGVVTLSDATPSLASLTMDGGTLTFTNWTTKLTATTVTINAGIINHVANSDTAAPWAGDARVWIDCTDLIVASGGKIDVTGLGYYGGNIGFGGGPGGGNPINDGRHGPGAGHGGEGAVSSTSYGGRPYGSVSFPEDPGSGGSGTTQHRTAGGAGGGCVRVDASGLVTVNGAIRANGESGEGVLLTGGGSGGSVYITCNTFAGTNGVISVAGGGGASPGGGGRIAVIFDTVAQASEATPNVAFDASAVSGTFVPAAQLGTLYFPNNSLLSENLSDVNGQISMATNWSSSQMTITNSWIRFADEGIQVTVSGNVVVAGSSGRLDLGGSEAFRKNLDGEPIIRLNTNAGPTFTVGGNLLLTDKAKIHVYAGPTNSFGYGAHIDVAQTMTVEPNCWVYPHSHPTKGGSAFFEVGKLNIEAGGGFSANRIGFLGASTSIAGSYNGFGPGHGVGAWRNRGTGGGYGGQGGRSLNNSNGGISYGVSNAPAMPGSGGGQRDVDRGGNGGGLVWVKADSNITVDGTITANGQTGQLHGGGGSGGGVYLLCKVFAGEGAISANGGSAGSSGSGGAGGGGRIALLWGTDSYSGSTSVEAGTVSYSTDAEAGTIVSMLIQPQGTVILIQ